jgi:virginiamycin B lyase
MSVRTLLMLLVLPVLSAAQTARPPQPVKPGVTTPGVQMPMSVLKPEAVFAVPGAPDWIAVSESVWISNKPRNSITRIDPATNKVIETIAVGSKPCSGLAIGFGSLWVPNCGDGTLSRVDLRAGNVTATIPISIASSEGGLAAGAGSIWLLSDRKGTLVRLDPATNKPLAEIQVPAGSCTAAFGENAVWVTGTETGVLTRVDPATNLVTDTIPVGKSPRFLAVGGGYVWTLNQADGSVSKVDVSTKKLVATIEVGVPGPGGEIAYGEGSVWVTSFGFPLSRIDPASNRVVQQFVGEGGDAVRVGLGSVWLSNLKAGTVWRLDPRRIEAALPAGKDGIMSAQTPTKSLKLRLLKGRLAVCRMDPGEKITGWAVNGGEFTSITRTAGELSVVCSEGAAPKGTKCENGWRIFMIEGPLDFALTGILVSVAKPLADAGISIFAISTYDTDYVMVKEQNVEKAVRALSAAGHQVQRP